MYIRRIPMYIRRPGSFVRVFLSGYFCRVATVTPPPLFCLGSFVRVFHPVSHGYLAKSRMPSGSCGPPPRRRRRRRRWRFHPPLRPLPMGGVSADP